MGPLGLSDDLFYPPHNFAGLDPEDSAFEKSKVVILPVPYDSTVSGKSGTRDGPRAIIEASQQLELYDPELDCEISRVGIHTLPELAPALEGPEAMVHTVYHAAQAVLSHDKLLVTLGGEHSVTIGVVRAMAEKYPNLSVLYIDAHADMRETYLGTRYNHACSARRVMEMCPVVLVGVRSLSLEEARFIREHQVALFPLPETVLDENTIGKIASSLTDQVYISIDLDALDPSIMAAVGTPEPGGLAWNDTLSLLQGVTQQKKVVGFDVMELSPSLGPYAASLTAAKLAYKTMGYVMQEWGKRTPKEYPLS